MVSDVTDHQDWQAVGRWVEEHTRVWTSADLARHGIDKKTLDKIRSGEKVRADARGRISRAFGLGDDGLDRIADGEQVSPATGDGRLAAMEERLAAIEELLRRRVR